MPWPEVKCNLNYKDKCPGIIYKKDFAKYRKANRRVAPKKRTEVGSTGICWTCANAQRSEVRDARLRNEILGEGSGSKAGGSDGGVKRGHQAGTAPTVSGSPGPNAGHQAGTAPNVSGLLGPNAGHQAGTAPTVSGSSGTGGESDGGDTVSATNPDALGAGGEQCSSSKGGGGPMYSLVASQGSIGSIPMCSKKKKIGISDSRIVQHKYKDEEQHNRKPERAVASVVDPSVLLSDRKKQVK